MPFADTLGAEALASQYFMQRLAAVRQAQKMTASMQFDLARSPLSDDELENVIDQFRDTPQTRSGWGLSEGLNELISREPRKVPISDLKALQTNLVAQGYAPPDAEPTGTWDPSWYAAFRRWDRDNFQKQLEGRHWYSAPIESGVRALTNTLPSRVFQGIVGATKGIITQTPETAERLGLLGGAAAGAGIGTAIVPGAGTLIGAGIGAAGGFLMDLFSDDEGEEDQSGAEKLIDALQPFNEYAEQGPKAFFEDLGFVLSAASMATGVGIAARGISTGVGALQAARAAGTTLGPRAALARGPLSAASIAAESRVPSLASTMFARPAAANQLGVFGTVLKAATRRAGFSPGSIGALESSMLKYSPIAFGQRYGPNIILKGFGGLSQAQMGARLFGGIGQGSRGDLEAAREAMEAELGRDLKEHEVAELEAKTAQTAIERSIATAPELQTGVELPLIGDLVDVAAFVLYPQRLLPFRGAQLSRSATNLMGDTLLAPYAHAVQHQNPGMGIKAAVSQVKGWLKPVDNAWLRADYGIHREAYRRISTAFRGNVERAFRRGALPNARADIIRQIRSEYDQSGKSELLERIMRYSTDTVDGRDGPTDFTSWLVDLNGQHRGLDRLASWKEANQLAKKAERELNGLRLNDPNFMISEGRLRRLSTPRPGGRVVREGPASNLDEMVLVDRVRHNEELAKRFDRIANRGARDPFTSMAARERARLARSEAETLKQQLDALRGAKSEKFTEKVVVTPARLDFADRAVLTAKRKEYLNLRQRVIAAVDSNNLNEEVIARQEMSNFVDQLAAEGHIADDVARKAKTGTPSERIAKELELQAKAAAKPIDLPPEQMAQWEKLGYKPVQAGDDVLFPDQLDRMWEVAGIGDYTRRAQVWETLGLSPKWRSDRSLFNLRREHEVAELNQVFAETGIALSGEQALRRLHDHLAAINHEGGQLGPFIKPKTGKVGLYKVDVRDLSPERILEAFDDVAGMTDEVAHRIFGALRRGAAYGGELRMLRPVETVKAMGKAMRINGLPGFSDLVRTWHADVPMRMSRGALRREEFNYKPVAELAHSPQRARVEVHLKDVASRSNVSEGQRQFGMMMLDSLAQSQVRQGRFGSVDEFFERVGAGYAERYVRNVDNSEALLRRVMDAPRTSARGAAKVDPLDRLMRQEFDRYLAHVQELDQSPSWYESSAAGFNRLFAGSEITLRDGSRHNMADIVARIVAETSGGKYPAENLKAAFKALKNFLDNKSFRHADIPAGSQLGYHQYGKNVYRKVDAILDGKFPSTDKYGPFYHAVMGDLDNIVVDRRMAVLFGIHHPTLNDVEKAWIKEQVTDLAQEATRRLGHKVYPAHVQERLWLRFNQIIDESERLARRRGDTELADQLAAINRVDEEASADYGTLIAENAPLKKGSKEGFRDLTESVFGEIESAPRSLSRAEAETLVDGTSPDALMRYVEENGPFAYHGTYADDADIRSGGIKSDKDRGVEGLSEEEAFEYGEPYIHDGVFLGSLERAKEFAGEGGKVYAVDIRNLKGSIMDVAEDGVDWDLVVTRSIRPEEVKELGEVAVGGGGALRQKLFQQAQDDVLGMTQFGDDYGAVMTFFRNADFSTLVHENAHLLRRLMSDQDVAQLEKAYGLLRTQGPEGASEELRAIAKQYHDESGIPLDRDLIDQYPEIDEARAKRIADAFENQKPTPRQPATRRAYKKFAKETMAQYEVLKRNGIKMIPWAGEGQPYHGAADFIRDIRENKRLYYFKTLQDDAFGAGKITEEQLKNNPLLESSGVTVLDSAGKPYEQTYNDIFRAVHDIMAHGKEGVQTGARGEESAWRAHAAMYSDEARRAMTTETRGQNSWVNFGPHLRDEAGNIPKKGEPGFVPPQDRPFSEQKVMLLPEEFSRIENTRWTREAEERFARDAEAFFLGKAKPQSPAMVGLRHALGALWRQVRPAVQESNSVPREVRQLLDKTFEDVLRKLPERRGRAALQAVGSKQALGGALAGGALGLAEGDDPSDILRGVAMGTGVGLGGRALLRRTHGYLPDYLTRANTALRYTLSFTFDAGRYTEQNLIAMSKHGLPPMLAPTKYIKAREWRSPFSAGKVSGDAAWKDAVRFYDEINGTSWFMNIDDLDRRMFQAGMLGFSPRNWEVAQAFQLYQRGMGAEAIREAVTGIGRYGLGRTAAEKSANFVVFPFSFSKKLLSTLGDFFLQAPARSLLLHEGFRRYHESEFDEKVSDFLDRRVPILKELSRINNLAYGISPGRFFLQGMADQRTGFGKAMQALASVFVPSGAATSLQQAIGSAGDLAIHAFTPIVLTGESITKMGGMDPITEIFRRYIPFIREIDQYFLADDAAVRSQITALKEGAEPYYQFQAYQDGLREEKAGYEGLAAVLGYSGVDGLLQSNMGLGIQAQLEQKQNELAEQYPTGFAMSQRFENSSAIDDRAILELAEKAAQGRASESEERILALVEDVERFELLKQFMSIDPALINAMAAKSIRAKATQWSSDARFSELYDRFFTRTYGPIRRVA